eukprot:scaffold55737_cov58-Attheya_sp.AAC.4
MESGKSTLQEQQSATLFLFPGNHCEYRQPLLALMMMLANCRASSHLSFMSSLDSWDPSQEKVGLADPTGSRGVIYHGENAGQRG